MKKKVLEHFRKIDPVMHKAAIKVDYWTLKKSENYFDDLTSSIISQQLSGKVADTIYARFKKLFRKEVVDPGAILKIPDEKIRKVGISWSKVTYIKDLAKKTVEGEIDLTALDKLPDEGVVVELTKIKGVGRWTAEMFLMFSLGREDVFSYGDLGLKKGIIRLYGLSAKPTDDQIRKIESGWSPYRTYASMVLWRSLDSSK